MDKLRIRGGKTLAGTVDISGAKNAALPELCAALLSAEPVTLTNVPRLQDVSTMLKLIRNMGVTAEQGAAGTADSSTVKLDAGSGARVIVAIAQEAKTSDGQLLKARVLPYPEVFAS